MSSRVLAPFLLILTIAGPSSAQVDVSGEWGALIHEDLPHRGGMRLGDYTGLPLNEAGFRKAASWDEAMRSIPEWQCVPHVVTYASEDTVVTECFDRLSACDSAWLTVLTVVEDPQCLDQPFVTSTHFKKETDGSKWAPAPCE